MKTISLAMGLASTFLMVALSANGQQQTKEAAPAKEIAPAKEAAPAKEVAPAKDGAAAKEAAPAKDGAAAKDVAPAKEKGAASKAMEVMVGCFDELATTLAGVTDKASAEAAVPKIQKIRETVDSQKGALQNADQGEAPVMMEMMERIQPSIQKIEAEMQRLNEKQFFGCKELESVFN